MTRVITRRIFSSTSSASVPYPFGSSYERFGPLGVLLSIGTGGAPTLERVDLRPHFLGVGTGGSATQEYIAARGDWGYSYEWLQILRNALAHRTVQEKIARVREVLVPAATDLAKLLGVSRQAIHDWQTGKKISTVNLLRVDDLSDAADVFALEGLRGDSRELGRPIRRGKTLFQLFKEGSSAAAAARALVDMLRVEAEQRAALQERLAGRKRRPSREIFEDFGVPTLNEGDH